MHSQWISNEIIAEPRKRGAEHRNPVPLKHQAVGDDILLHGMFAVLRAVDQTKPEEEQQDWKHGSESEGDAPDAIVGMLTVRHEDNQCNYARYNESEINGEVCGYSYEHPTLSADILFWFDSLKKEKIKASNGLHQFCRLLQPTKLM